ncbi:nucleoside-diphosphate kinase [archaeon]|nr:MAG: nucleoside-diphosphate kinase [archaeon]
MMEKTFVIIKPDAMKKNLVGKIVARFEENSLRVAGMKMVKADLKLASKHYPDALGEAIAKKAEKAGVKTKDPKEYGMKILRWLREFIISYPVVAMVLEGDDAISRVRKLIGYTDPATAEKGTIRRDFGDDSVLQANIENRPVYNLVHASDSPETAKHEISLWFKNDELFRLKPPAESEEQ